MDMAKTVVRTERIEIRLSKVELERLDTIAKRDGVSRSDVVRFMLNKAWQAKRG